MKTVFVAMFASAIGCPFAQPVSAAPPAQYTEKVLYSFCSQTNCADGASPLAGVIDVKGTLYGTTVSGGNASCQTNGSTNGSGCGTVFSLDPATDTEKVLYSFCSQTNCADGAYSRSGLVVVNKILFGTTLGGGDTLCTSGCGTAFSLDPATDTEKVLYSFCSLTNCADGATPSSGLLALNDTLYGTTGNGGKSGGTVFSLDPATDTEKVLYSFCSLTNCADGQGPFANLIYVNGMLYGTTIGGGPYPCGDGEGCGTVYSLDPNSGMETVLHSFGKGKDGKQPEAGLIAVNGILYGTTNGGGGSAGCIGNLGCGTVFSVNPKTGAEKVLYAFCSRVHCADGANPDSLINVKGTLYGTAGSGGDAGCGGAGCGTAFFIDPNTGAEKVLHTFGNGTDGQGPVGSLIDVKGTLYGTTGLGGAYGYGTVFAITKR